MDLSERCKLHITGYLGGPVVMINGKAYEPQTELFYDLKTLEDFIVNADSNGDKFYLYMIMKTEKLVNFVKKDCYVLRYVAVKNQSDSI